MPFNDAASVTQYLNNLLSEADLTQDQRDTIQRQITANADRVVKKANELAVPRSDYSSSLDSQRAEWEAKQRGWDKEKEEYKTWYSRQKERVETWERDHANTNANPNANPNPNPAPASSIDFDQLTARILDTVDKRLDKRFESQGEAVLGVTEDYISLATDYQARFGKRLPVEEVRKKAIEEGTNLRIAYDRYIAPDVKKQQDDAFDLRLKQAREEGRIEGASRATNPSHPGALDGHPVFARRDLPPDYSKMTSEQKADASQAAFERHWNETAGFTQAGPKPS